MLWLDISIAVGQCAKVVVVRIPPFNAYFPSFSALDSEQRTFLNQWRREKERGTWLPVGGQVSYLFLHVYELLLQGNVEQIRWELSAMLAQYEQETVFTSLAAVWLSDSFVIQGDYDGALEAMPLPSPGSRATSQADSLLTLKAWTGRSVSARDVIAMVGPKVTKYGRENIGLIEKQLEIQLRLEEEVAGRDLLTAWRDGAASGPYPVFISSPAQRYVNREGWTFSLNKGAGIACLRMLRLAENIVREEAGIPHVGEGWVAETELFYRLREWFSNEPVLQHAQFDWLGRQHVDIYFPERRVAVEYQGLQHDEPVAFFGGEEAFRATQARDRTKRRKCEVAGVRLVDVRDGYRLDEVIRSVEGSDNA